MGQKYRHANTSVSLLNYHFVWIVRRRRKILSGELDTRLKELIQDIAPRIECEILAVETDSDHVHLFLNCPPTLAPSQIIQRIKGATSHALREEFPWLKQKLPSLWTRSYFVSTAGSVSSDTIKKYIESQRSR
ncbi:MAG: IS200/IS605 family transposase ISPlu2 [Chroococcidiopsis cubana SAG 39.79]|uniref:IS200/IS605 family transposase n=1 Tax=Chroococcidiopsis cubana SAG 39.79 TaxID=388085 RepID=A0AB37USK9_9CYAN|nr:IS200/IS605 family transposase [Chroococcidiopsis cubana]MDZ4878287.1 IS200/IS605 family transposase ISPlu2 [Chroococcidiopsis cubana SAG 39.79]PSB65752.1 IS200/IS605 family transposase [Chroococcidiopsis cubana CCALA 043]RUT14465.1 IS200/IS605 family transposase [Chroococcidiopsis cubana SAG 39.79]